MGTPFERIWLPLAPLNNTMWVLLNRSRLRVCFSDMRMLRAIVRSFVQNENNRHRLYTHTHTQRVTIYTLQAVCFWLCVCGAVWPASGDNPELLRTHLAHKGSMARLTYAYKLNTLSMYDSFHAHTNTHTPTPSLLLTLSLFESYCVGGCTCVRSCVCVSVRTMSY